MRPTKRPSIEFWHREAPIPVEGSTLNARTTEPSTPPNAEVCPDCSSPWIHIVELTQRERAADADRICHQLRLSGLHLQVSPNSQLKICKKSFEEIKEMF